MWYNINQLVAAFLGPLLAEVEISNPNEECVPYVKNFLVIPYVFAGATVGLILGMESNHFIVFAIERAREKKIIAMPTNVNYNHWTAVVFFFHNNVLHILHNDPLGKEIDEGFLKVASTQAELAGCEHRIHDYKVEQQQDPYSTGAYTAESIYKMVQQLRSPGTLDLKDLDDILRKQLQDIGGLHLEVIQTLHTPKAMKKVSSTVKELDSEEEIAAAVWQSLLTSLCLKNAQFQSLQAPPNLTSLLQSAVSLPSSSSMLTTLQVHNVAVQLGDWFNPQILIQDSPGVIPEETELPAHAFNANEVSQGGSTFYHIAHVGGIHFVGLYIYNGQVLVIESLENHHDAMNLVQQMLGLSATPEIIIPQGGMQEEVGTNTCGGVALAFIEYLHWYNDHHPPIATSSVGFLFNNPSVAEDIILNAAILIHVARGNLQVPNLNNFLVHHDVALEAQMPHDTITATSASSPAMLLSDIPTELFTFPHAALPGSLAP